METLCALLAFCARNPPFTGKFLPQRLVICAWKKSWVNNREAGDMGHHRTHYDVTVMYMDIPILAS